MADERRNVNAFGDIRKRNTDFNISQTLKSADAELG